MEETEGGKGSENDAQFLDEINRRGAEVGSLMQKKDKAKALAKALENPPTLAKSSQVKVCIFVILYVCVSIAL